MKALRILPVMALLTAGWITSAAQTSEPQVPGDQFSLEGALELFKQSESPEEFEKMLNSPDAKVNNLDLNGDGYIDYIRVVDRNDGNVHAFILQALVSESESQDIAVIELEKLANGKAVLQIVGDEDIYGVTTIIEPTKEVRTYAGTRTTRTVVNVWAWPSVQFIYGPRYSVWVSPWGWHHRPVWWRTWRPVTYVHYYSVWRPYHRYYTPCYTRRVVYAHTIYRPYRRTSVVVHNRYDDRITRYRAEHRDANRYERSRRDAQLTFANDTRTVRRDGDVRSDAVRNRPFSPSGEATRPSNDSRSSRSTMPANIQSRSYEAQKTNAPTRSTFRRNDRVETPRQATPASPARERATPNLNTTRSYTPERRAVRRSSSPNIRQSAPTDFQRSAGVQQRSASPPRNSRTVTPRRETPPPMARPSTPSRGNPGGTSGRERSFERRR